MHSSWRLNHARPASPGSYLAFHAVRTQQPATGHEGFNQIGGRKDRQPNNKKRHYKQQQQQPSEHTQSEAVEL